MKKRGDLSNEDQGAMEGLIAPKDIGIGDYLRE